MATTASFPCLDITQSLTLPRPLSAWELRMTSATTVAEIDRLLDHHTEGQIAIILNDRGLRSGEGKRFHGRLVARIRRHHGKCPAAADVA